VIPDRGLSSAFLLLHPEDGRVLFVIPWLGKTLIGTTDTHCDGPPDELAVTPEEIAYLLAAHNHYFERPLKSEDVLSSFVGLRPLLHTRRGDPSSLTREFRLFRSPSGLLSVAGGKYTTYRRMAEVITDEVARFFGVRRVCRTRHFPLDGAPRVSWKEFEPAEIANLAARYGLSAAASRHLVHRYGRRAADVAGYLDKDRTLAEEIVSGEPDMKAELAYQRDHEMALFPADHFLRRTRLGLFQPQVLLWTAQAIRRKRP
jgi:glycerol-3-phosphate dehydrogenase